MAALAYYFARFDGVKACNNPKWAFYEFSVDDAHQPNRYSAFIVTGIDRLARNLSFLGLSQNDDLLGRLLPGKFYLLQVTHSPKLDNRNMPDIDKRIISIQAVDSVDLAGGTAADEILAFAASR